MNSESRRGIVVFLVVICIASAASGGTAWMSFDDGIGLFNPEMLGSVGPGVLAASGGRASISDASITMISGSATKSHGEVTMTLCPQTDASNAVGLQIGMKGGVGDIYYSILVTADGSVTVSNATYGTIGTASFPDPAATDCTLTWSDDGEPFGMWVLLNGTPEINVSTYPFTTFWLFGVIATGPAGFEDFTAQGDNIPDHPAPSLPRGHITSNIKGWIEEGMDVVLTAPSGANWQWYKNGLPIPDATDESLSFVPIVLADSGSYAAGYDDGTKTMVVSYPLEVEVLPAGSLPLVWWPLAVSMYAAGLIITRKRRSRR